MAKNYCPTAESYNALDAIQSSAFLLALGENISEEMEERCKLYIEHGNNSSLIIFNNFFEAEEKYLRENILSTFGFKPYGKEKCKIIQEKYEALISQYHDNEPQRTIGFHS